MKGTGWDGDLDQMGEGPLDRDLTGSDPKTLCDAVICSWFSSYVTLCSYHFSIHPLTSHS